MGLQHDTSTLESTVMGDHKLHLVLFINSKDETSTKATEKFEEEYALTAQEMLKYGVRVGVVDCGLHKKAASKFGVQQYPTLVSVEGPSTINPYTKKNMRNVKNTSCVVSNVCPTTSLCSRISPISPTALLPL